MNKNTSTNQSTWILLLKLICASTGLIFLWHFPATAYHYGGITFIIAYMICLIMISMPLLVSELGIGFLGRHHKKSIETPSDHIAHVAKSRQFQWLSPLSFIAALIMLCFCLVLMSWATNYGVNSYIEAKVGAIDLMHTHGMLLSSHFDYNYTQTLLGILLAALFLFLLSNKKDQTHYRLHNILAFASLVIFFVTVVALIWIYQFPAHQWLDFFHIHWENFGHYAMWYHATIFALLSLLIGFGCLFHQGKKLQNFDTPRLIFWLVIGNAFTAMVMSLFVLPVFSTVATKTGLPLATLADAYRDNFALIALPKAMLFLTSSSSFLPVLFYITLFLFTATAALFMIETLVKSLKQYFPRSFIRMGQVATVLGLCFILLIFYGQWVGYQQIFALDFFVIHFVILFVSLVEVFLIGWVYDAQNLSYKLKKYSHRGLPIFFNFCLRFIVPVALLLFLLFPFTVTLTKGSFIVVMIVFVILTTFLGIGLHKRFYQ